MKTQKQQTTVNGTFWCSDEDGHGEEAPGAIAVHVRDEGDIGISVGDERGEFVRVIRISKREAFKLGGQLCRIASPNSGAETVNAPEVPNQIMNQGAFRTSTFRHLLTDVIPKAKRLVDLGAGALVFSRIAQDVGYRTTAVDGRDDRVPDDHDGIEFIRADVRTFDLAGYDVIANLGLLYHLTLEAQVELLARSNRATVILDTQVHVPEFAPTIDDQPWAHEIVERDGYRGILYPEKTTTQSSLDVGQSFWHTEPSLLAMIDAAGFSNVLPVDPIYASEYGARRFYVLTP